MAGIALLLGGGFWLFKKYHKPTENQIFSEIEDETVMRVVLMDEEKKDRARRQTPGTTVIGMPTLG